MKNADGRGIDGADCGFGLFAGERSFGSLVIEVGYEICSNPEGLGTSKDALEIRQHLDLLSDCTSSQESSMNG